MTDHNSMNRIAMDEGDNVMRLTCWETLNAEKPGIRPTWKQLATWAGRTVGIVCILAAAFVLATIVLTAVVSALPTREW